MGGSVLSDPGGAATRERRPHSDRRVGRREAARLIPDFRAWPRSATLKGVRVAVRMARGRKGGYFTMPSPSSIGEAVCPPRWEALRTSIRARIAPLLGLCLLVAPAPAPGAETGAPPPREIDLLSAPLDRVAPWPWKHFLEDSSKALADVWELRDGVLVCRGTPKGSIWLDRDLADFTLRLEWRWPPGEGSGQRGGPHRDDGAAPDLAVEPRGPA